MRRSHFPHYPISNLGNSEIPYPFGEIPRIFVSCSDVVFHVVNMTSWFQFFTVWSYSRGISPPLRNTPIWFCPLYTTPKKQAKSKSLILKFIISLCETKIVSAWIFSVSVAGGVDGAGRRLQSTQLHWGLGGLGFAPTSRECRGYESDREKISRAYIL